MGVSATIPLSGWVCTLNWAVTYGSNTLIFKEIGYLLLARVAMWELCTRAVHW